MVNGVNDGEDEQFVYRSKCVTEVDITGVYVNSNVGSNISEPIDS